MKRMKEPFHSLLWKASIGYNDPFVHMDMEVLEKYSELLKEHYLSEGFQLGLKEADSRLIQVVNNENERWREHMCDFANCDGKKCVDAYLARKESEI